MGCGGMIAQDQTTLIIEGRLYVLKGDAWIKQPAIGKH
jgi:hypothetical protein